METHITNFAQYDEQWWSAEADSPEEVAALELFYEELKAFNETIRAYNMLFAQNREVVSEVFDVDADAEILRNEEFFQDYQAEYYYFID